MSGPKHLWSGDWENQPEEEPTQRLREPRPQPEPVAPPPKAPAPRRRRSLRPWVVPVAIGVLVVAGAAFGLSKVFGNDNSNQFPPGPLAPPHVTGDTRPIMWLGMEIITSPQGVPVVETVKPYSSGDAAGLEPTDSIVLVNNRPVGSTGSISDAVKGLHPGDRVTLAVNSGGAVLTLVARYSGPPTLYP